VIGGGVVGAEIAYYLTYELNKKVKVVEMDKYIMNHACTANRGHLIHYLEQAKVELLNMTTLKKIEDGKVTVAQNIHKHVPNPYVTWSPILPENIENPMDRLRTIKNEIVVRELKADAVVLATGSRSMNELYFDCVAKHAANEIYNIGDSQKSARVFEAVRGAYRKGRNI
jgi:2-enoate reductase